MNKKIALKMINDLYEAMNHLTDLEENLISYGLPSEVQTIKEIIIKLNYFDEHWQSLIEAELEGL